MNSLLSAKIDSLSLDEQPPSSKWQHWIYDCKDLPIHDHKNNRANNEECQFCLKVKNFQSPQSTFESKENFLRYIKKNKEFCSLKAMKIFLEFNNEEGILPSKLAKSVSFNQKLGSAFFRNGIPPNNEHPLNALGGDFQLLLIGTTADKELLEKFDKIFNKIFKMTVNELEKGKFIKNPKEAYNNLMNLPFMIKIEIWIGNNWNQAIVKKKLIDKIEHELDKKELSRGIYRGFQYHLADRQRIRIWIYECPDRPFHYRNKNNQCTGNECQFCIEVSKHFVAKEYRVESPENWKDYIKEYQLIQRLNLMLEVIERNKEKIMPSFLAKSISFNRKLGAALFLNGIEPNYEHPLNIGGGSFRFLFYGTTGNEELLAKFDQIFNNLIDITIANISNGNSINGIFIRGEINPNGPAAVNIGYSDPTNLPIIFKLEVWIRNNFDEKKIKLALIDKILEKVNEINPRCFNHFYIPHGKFN